MGLLSPILRNGSDGRLTFWCPGCGGAHSIPTGPGSGPRWTWDGNAQQPTFDPSILVRTVRGKLTEAEWEEYDAEYARIGLAVLEGRFGFTCHSFVRAGQIQFLDDCSHALKGQTVPIPTWPIADWSDG